MSDAADSADVAPTVQGPQEAITTAQMPRNNAILNDSSKNQ
jgi:hypothetical protein